MSAGLRALAPIAALAFAVALLPGCGEDDAGGGPREATLVLDFVPGPPHAGIYRALEQGYYEGEGIELDIVEPTSTADTLKLIDAGKAAFGIADGIDVAGQIAEGRDARGILALAQRPMGGLIALAQSGYDSPADLEGETVGVTGVPSDRAVLDAVVSGAGGDPAGVDIVTIGFNGVQNLENDRIGAFTGYLPADGVQVETDGFETKTFALDEYGGPRYPGLVVFSTGRQIAADPELMRGFVAATVAGYRDVLADPASGVEALIAANPAIQEDFADASLRAHLPFLAPGGRGFGRFDAGHLQDLSDFMVESGLVSEPVEPRAYATNEFVAGAR